MHNLMQSIINRRDYFIIAAMLGFLHASLLIDFGSAITSALLLIHLGFFLLWQPVQKREEKYTWYNGIIFIGLMLAFAYWVNWWLIFAWLILLIGIAGGRVVTNPTERYVLFLVMIFLISELLIIAIPSLFTVVYGNPVLIPLKYVIIFIPFALLFFPPPYTRKSELSVDLLYAITASLMAGILALGSLVIMYHSGADYFTALIYILLAVGSCLLLISWLLSAHTEFGMLSQLWSRSLLNIGTPFEQWLADLSTLKDQHESPADFLEAAIEKLASLPWISGVIWHISDQLNIHGSKTKHEIKLSINTYPLTLYTRVPVSGALLLHCNLLIKLVEYFYTAKVNERELSKRVHMQAIFETGARITHDIKNLLQSMHSMVTILQADTTETDSKSILILKKQFPYFIQRLEQAMDKLQAPQQYNKEDIYLMDFWGELNAHYNDYNIEFNAEIDNNPLIPFDLFNSITENLFENAIAKRKDEPNIRISAKIQVNHNMISLMVTDTGRAIDEKITALLFKEPLKSDNGLGIGLLQAAKQAESMGYTLRLNENLTGNVCFELHN